MIFVNDFIFFMIAFMFFSYPDFHDFLYFFSRPTIQFQFPFPCHRQTYKVNNQSWYNVTLAYYWKSSSLLHVLTNIFFLVLLFCFFSLLFRVFIPWFSLWSISLALISCTFFSIANDCNCNDLILFYSSFIPKTRVHNSTTQVAPPVSLLFSNGFTFHLHYRCILPKVSMINFHGRHGHGTQLPLFVCLLVCLSICISVFRWMYCTMGEGYKIASRDKSTNR